MMRTRLLGIGLVHAGTTLSVLLLAHELVRDLSTIEATLVLGGSMAITEALARRPMGSGRAVRRLARTSFWLIATVGPIAAFGEWTAEENDGVFVVDMLALFLAGFLAAQALPNRLYRVWDEAFDEREQQESKVSPERPLKG